MGGDLTRWTCTDVDDDYLALDEGMTTWTIGVHMEVWYDTDDWHGL
jgi:hypothetical protein